MEAGGGDPVAVIRKYADRIPYMHFKDYGKGGFLPLGEGHQDFEAMAAALREAQYDGWVLVELDSHPDPLQAAKVSKAYLDDTLRLND